MPGRKKQTHCKRGHEYKVVGRYGSACAECCRKRHRAHKKDNFGRLSKHAANHKRLKRYGITVEEYNALLVICKGKCQICGGDSKRSLSVDHCHRTGMIRGLLCNSCNLMIGLGKDDKRIFLAAIKYLSQ